jgi:ADP-heptose:LPS heptosyltransferase
MSGAMLAIRLRALGDVVLTTPALRALQRGALDRPLDVVTETRYACLLEGLPGVRRVWGVERTFASTSALGRALARERYGLVVDFFGNPRSALLAARCRGARRAGYELRGRGRAYDLKVPRTLQTPGGAREYAAATHVRLAVAAGGVADGLAARVAVPPTARDTARTLLSRVGLEANDRIVGLVAAGTWATKTWPVSHAAILGRSLVGAGWRVLLIAGPGEEDVTRAMERLVPDLRVLPPCDVAALAAVIERCAAVAGTDSGPRHLAAALGVPTYAWFGPTHPDNWNPPGESHGYWFTDLPCRGCDRTVCPHWNCLPSLAPERASARVLEHLERHVPARFGPAAGA